MSAAENIVVDQYTMQDIHRRLRAWGYVCEKVRMSNPYPNCDTTHRAAFGGGGSDRLPIPDIPSWAVKMSHSVMVLPEEQSNAITIKFCYQLRPGASIKDATNGEWWWTDQDRAKVLQVSEWEFNQRVRDGKRALIRNGA